MFNKLKKIQICNLYEKLLNRKTDNYGLINYLNSNVILQKNVNKYFEVPTNFNSPYMQFTVKCKYPNDFPSIVHYDNTSRVQTVTKENNENLYYLLNKYEMETYCFNKLLTENKYIK